MANGLPAVVTGASSGIGEAFARQLAAGPRIAAFGGHLRFYSL